MSSARVSRSAVQVMPPGTMFCGPTIFRSGRISAAAKGQPARVGVPWAIVPPALRCSPSQAARCVFIRSATHSQAPVQPATARRTRRIKPAKTRRRGRLLRIRLHIPMRLLAATPPRLYASARKASETGMAAKSVKKVVLAYSGGLDTSVILRWLQTTDHGDGGTSPADLDKGEELEPARRKAEMLGIKEIFVDDLR